MSDTSLTPVEREVQGMQMQEHKAQKCNRCVGREDISGGFVCLLGMDAWTEMRNPNPCRKFSVDEDQDRWLV